MPEIQAPGFAAALLSSPQAGMHEWWRQIASVGTPLLEPQGEQQVRMTFLWRDPAGTERHSTIRQVYIDVNGVTDHHHFTPQSLQRLPGTDVWHWSVEIERDWRGSYCLIPVGSEHLPPAFTDHEQQREWWCSLFPLMTADPLNPSTPWDTWTGKQLSAVHLPDALPQAAWSSTDGGTAVPADPSRRFTFEWHSPQLGNCRRIWLYVTGHADEPAARPLAIVLDGQKWAEETPLFAPLDEETDAGRLPAAVYLFIDAIDMPRRSQELPCNPVFWRAVQDELLPMAAQYAAFSDDPDRTLVSGQSYGGLASLYAGLHWPERFGRVLTQSGSFWWPHQKVLTCMGGRHEQDVGMLIAEVRQRGRTARPLVVFQEAGRRESDIHFVNQQMNAALNAAGHHVHYRVYNGGHDMLCWRGGLIDGLRWLLTTQPITTNNKE
ncbi:enterochelin esterase [Musicola keenii]|uniref:enterochelin esterase n=1 Tax=Musicola keenii TaxID=2884250 RepID=UPI00178547C8|nr:enterochelin esterase [Musicola keenii]